MAAHPSHNPRLLSLAPTLATMLLAALVLAAAVAAAPTSAATAEDYFFMSSIGPTYGSSGQYEFGPNGAGPNGICVDANGNVYVTLPRGFAKFSAAGNLLCHYVGETGWYTPSVGGYGIDVDGSGRVYYADSNANRVVKLSPSPSGLNGTSFSMVNMYGKNSGDGTAGTGAGEFTFPSDVAVDGNYLYVADTNNNRIQKFEIISYDNTLSWVASWGAGGGDGTAGSGNGQFSHPRSIAADHDGNIYVTDTGNQRIQVLDTDGDFVRAFGVSTPASDPLYLSGPIGIDVDAAGDVYVTDLDNPPSRVGKYRLVTGSYQRVAYFGGWGTGDAQFRYPWGVAVAPNGYLYVTDTQNQKLKKFARDATAPTVTPPAFPAGWVKTFDFFELRATDPTVAGQYTSNGVSVWYSRNGGAVREYLEPLVSLDFAEGDNAVTYYATDAVGNSSTPATDHLYWDKTVPVTAASGAAAGWTKTAQTITLTPGSDGYSPISSTQYRLEGAASWTTYAAPFLVSADGDHVYEFRSTDSATNVEAPKTVEVKVDGTAPVTAVSGLTGGWTNDLTDVTFNGTDEVSGVASTEWSADTGANWASGSLVGVFPEGVNSVQFRSTDAAGNVEQAKTATVSYDLSKPVPAALASKSVKRLKTVRLPYRVSDLRCPKATVTIRIYKGAKLKKTLSVGLKTVGLSLTYGYKCKLAKGSYTWKVYATDLAGNTQAKPAVKKLTVK